MNKAIPFGIAFLILLATPLNINATDKNKELYINKIVGSDRYETNIKTIEESFETSEYVSIGNNLDIQETVKALNYSISKEIPFLLSPDGKINESMQREIDRLNALPITNEDDPNISKNVVIINHTSDLISSIGYAVKNKATIIYSDGTNLPNLANSNVLIVGGLVKNDSNYNQIIGNDRYETNKLLNERETFSKGVLVSGENSADSLSAVNLAIKKGYGIYLSSKDGSNIDINNSNVDIMVGGDINIERKILYLTPHQDDEILTMGLSLLRDIKDNPKHTYLMLLTDGSSSKAINKINRDLVDKGLPCITHRDMTISRNKEMLDCLGRLNMLESNIIIKPYGNLYLSSKDVESEIHNFHKKYKNIELKTLSANSYDLSDGIDDHTSCKIGASKYGSKYNINTYLLSDTGGNYLLTPDEEESDLLKYAALAYEVYDIEENRYAVGYTSVKNSFDNFKKGFFNFGLNIN
ncbi:cell wall-binding repeat-containing protein [Peptostreptococcus faecalis]|uniref:cell wall-binding repeat-containing protein n=1 Tax=Peptostreptococcus faecalis TaxID=2045015 RepID=UPI000C7C539C|nr:cell wall-binding repeat-containing protein [Peptostreptococcus faecalis]